MNKESKTAAEAQANAEEISDVDATQAGPRGNVHSEEGPPAEFDAPPPFES